MVPAIQLKTVTAPDAARLAGSRKNPEPIMLLATTNVARTGPILRVLIDATYPLPLRSLLWRRSEEHTSELPSLMRSSYAVFCLKKKKLSLCQAASRHTIQHHQSTCNI